MSNLERDEAALDEEVSTYSQMSLEIDSDGVIVQPSFRRRASSMISRLCTIAVLAGAFAAVVCFHFGAPSARSHVSTSSDLEASRSPAFGSDTSVEPFLERSTRPPTISTDPVVEEQSVPRTTESNAFRPSLEQTPALCSFQPCSTHELGNRWDSWCRCWSSDPELADGDCMSYNLCGNESKQLCNMSALAPDAKLIAENLRDAMPHLNLTNLVLSSESQLGGEVVAVINPGDNLTKVLPEVLGITYLVDEVEIHARDWRRYVCGFNQPPGISPRRCRNVAWPPDVFPTDSTDATDLPTREIIHGTRIMADTLVDGFMFTFKDDGIAVAPYIYGGFTRDRQTVVGVLTSRVWT
eukprot:TRINITY_DN32595_c0_g1_i1.p1 TRINITY_DN32595_c0_g1~~TRINITY_DN32595_c0_g1_i1.p1  ORF type:complete len:353 (+),score=21.32 TRINITY_DN32595_c0_g1_i1:147-1205(+)